jgi:hypothetical protein
MATSASTSTSTSTSTLTPAPIPASTLAPTSTAAVTAVTATTTTATTAGGDTSGADFDVVVIGAGVTGIYAVHKFRNELGLSTCAFEAAEDIGGVWYVNRYPGARCDCESYMYAYSFSKELEQSWRWRSKFPSQAELLEYLNHVVERFDLRRSFRFGTRVTSATYDPAQNLWEITTDRGTRTRARYLVTGVGCLSEHDLSHERLAAPRGRFHREARRRGRHGRERRAGDHRDREAGRSPHGIPAHGELRDAARQ